QVPLHVEELRARGMQAQRDGFALGHAGRCRVADGVEAKEFVVRGAADHGFHLGHHARAPSPRHFEDAKPLLKLSVVDLCHVELPIYPASMSISLFATLRRRAKRKITSDLSSRAAAGDVRSSSRSRSAVSLNTRDGMSATA